jgi:hypothetical protein
MGDQQGDFLDSREIPPGHRESRAIARNRKPSPRGHLPNLPQ